MLFKAQSRTGSKNRRESRRALIVSVAVHMVVGAGLIRLLLLPGPVRNWLGLGKESKPQEEHIQYVAVPSVAPTTSTSPARRPPSPAQQIQPPGGPTIVAPPTTVPQTVAPAPAKSSPPAEVEGVGPVARTGGPGAGSRFEYHDGRVYVPPAPPGEGAKPRTLAVQLDSAAHAMVSQHNDSLAMLGPTRKPGDWTKEIGGQKWGMDQQYIHLGPISIPNAVLAALPLNNFTGNPIAAENERLLNSRQQDIQYQANRQMDADEMNKAIKEERLRKEREHEEQQKQKQQQSQPSQPNTTPPVANSNPPSQSPNQ
jgi:hypothetical protein